MLFCRLRKCGGEMKGYGVKFELSGREEKEVIYGEILIYDGYDRE